MKLIATLFIIFAIAAQESRAQNPLEALPTQPVDTLPKPKKPKVIRASNQCDVLIVQKNSPTQNSKQNKKEEVTTFADKIRLYTNSDSELLGTYTALPAHGAKDQTKIVTEIRKISADQIVMQVITKGHEQQIGYALGAMKSGLAYRKQSLLDQYGIKELTKPITYEKAATTVKIVKNKEGVDESVVSLEYKDPMEPKRRAYAEVLLLEQLLNKQSASGQFETGETLKCAATSFQNSNLSHLPKLDMSNKMQRMGLDNYQYLNRRIAIDTLRIKRANQ